MQRMFTFLVRQSDGSVKEFCEVKSHLCPNRPQKRNISFEIYLKKTQGSYPLNTQATSYNNVPQNPFMSSMAPPPQIPQPTSISSLPLTQNPYPPNNQTSSSTDDQSSQFTSDLNDVQPDFESEVAYDHFFDIDPFSNFDFNWPLFN